MTLQSEAEQNTWRIGPDTTADELEEIAEQLGASVGQNWPEETTTVSFRDGSRIVINNESIEVIQ